MIFTLYLFGREVLSLSANRSQQPPGAPEGAVGEPEPVPPGFGFHGGAFGLQERAEPYYEDRSSVEP